MSDRWGAVAYNAINEKVLNDAICYANELIDAHLRGGRYVLPLETGPTVLRDMAGNLVTHRLYLRRPERRLPGSDKLGVSRQLKNAGSIA